MPYDPVYYRMYYAQHREEILKKRRKKYHTDEEYRRKVIEYAKKYRKLHYQPRPRVNPENWEKVILGVRLYSVGKLYKALGIKYSTIVKWFAQKVIPRSPIKVNLKYYYTEKMIEMVKEVITEYKAERQRWYDEILKRWQQDDELKKVLKHLTKQK